MSKFNIAVIMTCYNRREKTLNCLDALYEAYTNAAYQIKLSIWLTDDGCTDNTAEAVMGNFSNKFEVHIQSGNGTLFWGGDELIVDGSNREQK